MRDREIICAYYVRRGECAKGRKAEHYKICQSCSKYLPLKGAKPARVDRRREKLAKIQKKERYNYY